ncbi:TPA: MFS transporter [Serratia marcescens]|nr:MFS transporter [Serratia marcescens]HEJ7076161.1 MFS transporter [Serratia marcescens]HEJ7199364.1 MFS transporter [Serratia marcescens]HEJ9033321.1 MFS transporter [Serratia marcescens]
MSKPVDNTSPASAGSALAATSIGYVIVQLDISVANVALPHIAEQLQASTADLQWVIDAYSLVFASLLLAAGSCADRFGCRRVYAAGLLLFCLASAACGMATSAAVLITFRALQGLGGALIFPASLALLNHACRKDEAARIRAIGWWSTSGAFAVAAGPVVGGILVLHFGWRSVFLINVPLCVLAVWLLLTRMQETPRSRSASADVKGLVLAAATLALLTAGLIEAGRYGWSHPLVLGSLAISGLAGGLFLHTQKKATTPLLPLGLFGLKGFSGAALVSGTISLTFFGLVFFLSLFFQNGMGYSASQTGLAFLPLTGAIMGGKILGNHMALRLGTAWPVTVGLILAAGGNVFLLLVTTGITTPYALLAPGLLLISLGNGLASSVIMSSGLTEVPKHLSGTASAVLTTARQTGGVIGVALFGSFMAEGAEYAPGARTVFLVSALLLVAVAAVTTSKKRK